MSNTLSQPVLSTSAGGEDWRWRLQRLTLPISIPKDSDGRKATTVQLSVSKLQALSKFAHVPAREFCRRAPGKQTRIVLGVSAVIWSLREPNLHGNQCCCLTILHAFNLSSCGSPIGRKLYSRSGSCDNTCKQHPQARSPGKKNLPVLVKCGHPMFASATVRKLVNWS